ncbi:hypothetical protein C8R45DRAFT_937323 [Mycena sanguinolenta]|nr:hypothetical protein C8R45DRAFT_937323 [Mycena sanguinolenta]
MCQGPSTVTCFFGLVGAGSLALFHAAPACWRWSIARRFNFKDLSRMSTSESCSLVFITQLGFRVNLLQKFKVLFSKLLCFFWSHGTKKEEEEKRPLGHVVWNKRVMAVTMDEVKLAEEKVDVSGQARADFIAQLPKEAKRQLHITVGTVGEAQPAEAWRREWSMMQSIPVGGIVTMARMKRLY